jgi:hypothetical protein
MFGSLRSIVAVWVRHSERTDILWYPALDGAVNKRVGQSENPENSQVKMWGSASTLGVAFWILQDVSSNWRELATSRSLPSVADAPPFAHVWPRSRPGEMRRPVLPGSRLAAGFLLVRCASQRVTAQSP